jgi:hypothetical protein
MDIIFKAAKLRKLANEKKHRDRKLGTEMSGKTGATPGPASRRPDAGRYAQDRKRPLP